MFSASHSRKPRILSSTAFAFPPPPLHHAYPPTVQSSKCINSRLPLLPTYPSLSPSLLLPSHLSLSLLSPSVLPPSSLSPHSISISLFFSPPPFPSLPPDLDPLPPPLLPNLRLRGALQRALRVRTQHIFLCVFAGVFGVVGAGCGVDVAGGGGRGLGVGLFGGGGGLAAGVLGGHCWVWGRLGVRGGWVRVDGLGGKMGEVSGAVGWGWGWEGGGEW